MHNVKKKIISTSHVPLVNVSGILLGACALGNDSVYSMYRLYLSSGFSAGNINVNEITVEPL